MLKSHHYLRTFFLLTFFSFGILSPLSLRAEKIVLECDSFRYEILSNGTNGAFIDQATGKDYLKKGSGIEGSRSAYIKKGSKIIAPASVGYDGSILRYIFDDPQINASVRITKEKGRLIFEVIEVNGDPDSFMFVNIPLTLEAKPYEPFAACSLSLNLHTHVYQLPALHTELQASCYQRFGFSKAKAAVVGVPQKEILPTIRDIMRKAAPDVPFSDQGGAWALDAKEGYGSYLINHGALCEENMDEWIDLLQQLGFTQIDHHGTRSIEYTSRSLPKKNPDHKPHFFLFGSFELDPVRFPNGWKDFKKIVDKLHSAGISSLFHTYTMFISTDSKYVQPVPHPDLDTIANFTLASNIDEKATVIEVKESTANVSTDRGWTILGNRTIRIGNEIIEFTDRTQTAPYQFTGCTRGFQGTQAAAHSAGKDVGWLKTYWSGMYVPRPDSKLFDEIAVKTAQIVDECGFDGIYFDAIEGVQHLWGIENYWYYGDKFIFEVMKHLKKPVGVEYAGMVHHWWHYRNRYQAWDTCCRGYKRLLDIHIASMKAGEEYQHGCWMGHAPDILKYGSMKDGGLYLPLQIGWWSFIGQSSPNVENMFWDDIEYIGCKMIGNNAGFSFIGNIGKNMQEIHPVWKEFIAILKQYETLRKSKYFSEEICAQLRIPGKEFRLFQNGDQWNFKPVFHKKHKVEGVDHPTSHWTVQNDYESQPAQVRLEVLGGIAPYHDPAAITLIDSKTSADLKLIKAAPGITAKIKQGSDIIPATGESPFEICVKNNGSSPSDASWTKLSRTFEKPLDLKNRLGLGIWIHGDGKGEILDLRPFSGDGFASYQSSHFIKIDFKGWKYFELLESESTRISDYRWPKSGGYHVYDHYGGNARYNDIRELQIWFNQLPAGEDCCVKIGPVKALPSKPIQFKNPALLVNGQKVTFKSDLTTGMYIECRSENNCRLFNSAGVCLKKIEPEGSFPLLKKGENPILFQCDESDKTFGCRISITFSAEGKPL